MVRVTSGFAGMKQRQEAQNERMSGGDFIPYMRLKDDGDMVRFRIVSSHDSELIKETGVDSHLVSAVFHRHRAQASSGKMYFTATMCAKEEDEDDNLWGDCQLCDEEIPRSLQFMVWVWVYGIYHRYQNEDAKNPWERGRLGHMTVYYEPVERFEVWQDGFYSSQALETRIERFGTITDRDYERTRRGAKGNQKTTYELEYLDPSPIEDSIVEAAQELPSLIDVAEGRVATMDGRQVEEKTSEPERDFGEARRPERTENLDDLPF